MTLEQAQLIVKKYVDGWNNSNGYIPLWVHLVKPGAPVNIPGVTFGMTRDPEKIAGMHYRVNAQLIVIREGMVPESILTTFFHEYGHAKYESGRSAVDIIDSEVAAIRSSLELCVARSKDSKMMLCGGSTAGWTRSSGPVWTNQPSPRYSVFTSQDHPSGCSRLKSFRIR